MYIDDNLKQEIKRVFALVSGINTVFLFEAIPQKKLTNATLSYAKSLGSDEMIIALYDSTVFGSAKEGFILTSKRLYSKYIMGSKGEFVNINDINDIYIDHSSNSKDITVEISTNIIEINNTGALGNEDKLCAMLYGVVKLLGGLKSMDSVGDVSKQLNTEVRCLGCRAINPGNASECEYCGVDLSAARKKMTTAAIGSIHHYNECPDVPDFGAITGVPLLSFENESDSTCINLIYDYSKSYVTQEKINNYIIALNNIGYNYDGYGDGAYQFTKSNRSIHLNMNDNDIAFVQIFEED